MERRHVHMRVALCIPPSRAATREVPERIGRHVEIQTIGTLWRPSKTPVLRPREFRIAEAPAGSGARRVCMQLNYHLLGEGVAT
jgi:hypothetical protein